MKYDAILILAFAILLLTTAIVVLAEGYWMYQLLLTY